MTEHMQSTGSLVLYKFEKAAKPEVVFSLVVHPDFTWQLSYHRQLLGPSTSSCLKDVPSVFTTASDVLKLLQMLNGCHTCMGNPDMHLSRSVFMNATGIHKDTYTSKLIAFNYFIYSYFFFTWQVLKLQHIQTQRCCRTRPFVTPLAKFCCLQMCPETSACSA